MDLTDAVWKNVKVGDDVSVAVGECKGFTGLVVWAW